MVTKHDIIPLNILAENHTKKKKNQKLWNWIRNEIKICSKTARTCSCRHIQWVCRQTEMTQLSVGPLLTNWAMYVDRLSYIYQLLYNSCQQTDNHKLWSWCICVSAADSHHALVNSFLLLLLTPFPVFYLQCPNLFALANWVWKLQFSSFLLQFSTLVQISQIWAKHHE